MQQGAYQSDITQFIHQLKEKDPELEKKQKEGRSLLWDKVVDFDLWRDFRSVEVKQNPYVYYTSKPEDTPF